MSHLRFEDDRVSSLQKKSEKKQLADLQEKRSRQSDKKTTAKSKFLVTLSRFSYSNAQKSEIKYREPSGGKTLVHPQPLRKAPQMHTEPFEIEGEGPSQKQQLLELSKKLANINVGRDSAEKRPMNP